MRSRLTRQVKHETSHDDVIKWKHLPRFWPFVRGIHRSRANSPHKGQWRGALMLHLNKRLRKQWWGWWFETPSLPLWRQPIRHRIWVTRNQLLLWINTRKGDDGLSQRTPSSQTLRTKGRQFDNFVVTGGTVSCHNENLWCHQWWQSC